MLSVETSTEKATLLRGFDIISDSRRRNCKKQEPLQALWLSGGREGGQDSKIHGAPHERGRIWNLELLCIDILTMPVIVLSKDNQTSQYFSNLLYSAEVYIF